MVKPGLVLLAVLVLFTPEALKHGCHDLKLANTSVPYGYYPTRDMRHSIALVPQRFYRLPDSTNVPITGREPRHDQEIAPEERDAFAA
jgi:hypothetical protein